MRHLAALLTRHTNPRATLDQPRALRSPASRDNAPRRRALRLEQLEDRRVLSAISWDGGAGTLNWNDVANWSGDALPGASDDVTIDVAGDVTIVHPSGTADIHSLLSYESIDWSGGSLLVNSDSTVFGQFSNSGTVEVLSSTLALGGGTHTGDFLIGSGATLSVGGLFEASSDITGAGNLNLVYGTQRGIVDIGGNVALTGATIEGDFAVAGDLAIMFGGAGFSGTPATVGGAATVNGHMSGTGEVAIAGLLTWDLSLGAQMLGTGKTIANGGMHITGTGTAAFYQRTIENAGVAVFDGGTILAYNGAIFRNLPGASFEIQNDADITYAFGSTLFDNQGAFLKLTGAGVASVDMAFNNSGTVEVLAGTLSFIGGGTHTGDFLIGSGATLSVGGLFEASSDITGAGNLNLVYGTQRGIVDIGGNVALTGATIEGDFAVAGDLAIMFDGAGFSGTPATVGGAATVNGHMSGTGEVTIAGLLTWDLSLGAQMLGTGKTIANGGMHITGTGTAAFYQRTIENAGVAVFDGGTILAYNGAIFRNLPGASFEIQNDADITYAFGSTLFDNQGAFLKLTGAGVASVDMAFNNSGTVEVLAGTLSFIGGGTHTGDFLIGSGATLSVGGLFEASSDITGAGNLNLVYGTQRGIVDIGGNVALTSATIEGDFAVAGDLAIMFGGAGFSGTPATVGGAATVNGHMSGTGEVTIAGLLTWDLSLGAQMLGTGKTIANGGMHITGAGTADFYQRTIENAGVAVFDGGTIRAYNGAIFRNLPGASFEIQNDADITYAFGSTLFDNQGEFLKTTGAGVASLDIDFSNSGTVEVLAGTLSFARVTQTAGRTVLNGGSVSAASSMDFQGGTLEGSGTVFGNLANDGEVSPGFSPGLIEVQGNYLQNTAGIFKVELKGLAAGTQYDQLVVRGSVTLDGTLDVSLVSNFHPPVNQTFIILDNQAAGAIAGTFAGLGEGEEFIAGSKLFRISYLGVDGNGNDVVLTNLTLPGDFDHDGELECDDVDALSAAIAGGSTDLTYDLNNDNLVNLADLDEWVLNLKGTLFGDANLDFSVDGSDFNLWNAHKFTVDSAWCHGDFNADGFVDGSDFNVWNSNKFTSADGVPATGVANGGDQIFQAVPASNDSIGQSIPLAWHTASLNAPAHSFRPTMMRHPRPCRLEAIDALFSHWGE